MIPKPPGALALAALVILAGCAGYAPETTGNGPTGDATPAVDGTAATPAGGVVATNGGVVQLYVSDEKNAIGDFEHLNVTITKVGFQRAADADEDGAVTENAIGTDVNETTTGPATENGTPTATATAADEPAETEGDEDETGETEDDGDGSGGWTEYEVENRTVDLTRLQGENATLLSEFDVPEGEYTTVFVYVSEVDATLENGESTDVKLPSGKLQLNEGFTIAENGSVEFVFDITVHKAGKSGKYILTPVISESGTDVPIEDVDEERDDREEGDEERNEVERDSDHGLNASFLETVEPGANATVRVTANGSAVANATVFLDDERVGTTDGDGELTFGVPADAEEIELSIGSGDAEAELEAEFEDDGTDDDADEEDDRGNGSSDGGGNNRGG